MKGQIIRMRLSLSSFQLHLKKAAAFSSQLLNLTLKGPWWINYLPVKFTSHLATCNCQFKVFTYLSLPSMSITLLRRIIIASCTWRPAIRPSLYWALSNPVRMVFDEQLNSNAGLNSTALPFILPCRNPWLLIPGSVLITWTLPVQVLCKLEINLG